MSAVEEEKRLCRARLKAQRGALTPAAAAAADREIARHVLSAPAFVQADLVCLYISLPGEVDTAAIVAEALRLGKRVAAPRCRRGGAMELYEFTSCGQLCPGICGLREPGPDCPPARVSPRTLCLVPALAFDRTGARLGYGGGYYDRFLEHFEGRTAGLVRSAFVLDALPKEPHDQRVDALVTENGWQLLRPERFR